MLSSYAALQTQLLSDIQSAWSLSSSDVYFGRPRLPRNTFPYAVVKLADDGISRERRVRQRSEAFTFEIYGFFPWVSGVDLLELQLARAKELGDILTPEIAESMGAIASPAAYAGVGRGMFVPSIQCPDSETTDKHYAVILTFTVTIDASTE